MNEPNLSIKGYTEAEMWVKCTCNTDLDAMSN